MTNLTVYERDILLKTLMIYKDVVKVEVQSN